MSTIGIPNTSAANAVSSSREDPLVVSRISSSLEFLIALLLSLAFLVQSYTLLKASPFSAEFNSNLKALIITFPKIIDKATSLLILTRRALGKSRLKNATLCSDPKKDERRKSICSFS